MNAKKTTTRKRRGRGGGSLEKRGGVYLARWTVGGRRFSQSLGTADRREAERRPAEIVAPFRLATDAERLEHFTAKMDGTRRLMAEIEAAAPAVRIADAWDLYAESPERPETCEAHRAGMAAKWRAFADYMAKHYPDAPELRQVTRQHASAYMADFARTHSPETYNQVLTNFTRLWRFMADYPGAKIGGAGCPFDRIARRRKNAVSRRALTADELVRVCNAATGELRVLFAVGIYTGLRLKDCALLTWGEIDMTRRLVTCTPRKTARYGKVVNIPIHPTLYGILCETPEPKRRGYLLPGIASDYDCQSAVARKIRDVFAACGIDTQTDAPDGGRRRCIVGFHSLRHTFVSMAANAGAPLAVVQRIVEHAEAVRIGSYETWRRLTAAGRGANDRGLEAVERLQSVAAQTGDYRDAEIGAGDVVYCDPPYAGTESYAGLTFDSAAFWEWAASRPFPVFVSEYHAPDTFAPIWRKGKLRLMNQYGSDGKAAEFLFVQRRFAADFQTDLLGCVC